MTSTSAALSWPSRTILPSTPAVKRPALTSVTRRTANSVFARDRSINFCKFRTLLRSPTCDAVKIRCRNRSTCRSQARQSTASQPNSSPSGPFTATTAAEAMPNLPFGSSFVVIVSHTSSPDPRQPAFTAGHPARYPASYPRTAGRRTSTETRFPAAFRPPAFASRVILFPPRSWAFLTVGLPPTSTSGWTPSGLPRSTLTSYDRGGCPLYPGDRRCSPDRMPCPASAYRIPAARPYTPPDTSHRAELRFTRHQQGFTRFTRPVCPSPVALAMGRGPLRFPLGLRTPPLPAAHAKGRARHRARARDYTTDITSALLTASPLAKCDIVSQRQIRTFADKARAYAHRIGGRYGHGGRTSNGPALSPTRGASPPDGPRLMHLPVRRSDWRASCPSTRRTVIADGDVPVRGSSTNRQISAAAQPCGPTLTPERVLAGGFRGTAQWTEARVGWRVTCSRTPARPLSLRRSVLSTWRRDPFSRG